MSTSFLFFLIFFSPYKTTLWVRMAPEGAAAALEEPHAAVLQGWEPKSPTDVPRSQVLAQVFALEQNLKKREMKTKCFASLL